MPRSTTPTHLHGGGGYRFNPYFALEVGYYDLGTYAFSNNDGVVPSPVRPRQVLRHLGGGILPMNQFDLYGAWAGRSRRSRPTPTRELHRERVRPPERAPTASAAAGT